MDGEEAVAPQRPGPARGARGRFPWIKAAFITLWFAAWVFIICYIGRDTFDPTVFESLYYVFLILLIAGLFMLGIPFSSDPVALQLLKSRMDSRAYGWRSFYWRPRK